MPTPGPTLSERLLTTADHAHLNFSTEEEIADLREAARLLAPCEQPEVGRLLELADELDADVAEGLDTVPREELAQSYRAHAAALNALAEAQGKLKRVEAAIIGLRNDAIEFTMTVGDSKSGGALFCAADKLEAALADAGEKSEVTG